MQEHFLPRPKQACGTACHKKWLLKGPGKGRGAGPITSYLDDPAGLDGEGGEVSSAVDGHRFLQDLVQALHLLPAQDTEALRGASTPKGLGLLLLPGVPLAQPCSPGGAHDAQKGPFLGGEEQQAGRLADPNPCGPSSPSSSSPPRDPPKAGALQRPTGLQPLLYPGEGGMEGGPIGQAGPATPGSPAPAPALLIGSASRSRAPPIHGQWDGDSPVA